MKSEGHVWIIIVLLCLLTECVERVCDLSTSLVLVNNDVIPHTVCRVDANNGNHLQAFLLLELCQHFLGVIKELLGLFAHSLIVENFGIPSVWVPPPSTAKSGRMGSSRS